jgi:hypothetical protein
MASATEAVSPPPTEQEVAQRTLCLGVMVIRAEYEISVKENNNKPNEKIEKSNEQLVNLIQTENLMPSFSKREKVLIKKELGSWSNQDIADMFWRNQALAILLWAVSYLSEIRPYDKGYLPIETWPILFFPINKEFMSFVPLTKTFYSHIHLRSLEEINKARETAQHWYWRAQTERIIKKGKIQGAEGLTFLEIIKMSAKDGYTRGWHGKPIKNDLPIHGKAYADLTEQEFSQTKSLTKERYYALNWLAGYSTKNNWDEVPTNT